MRGNIIHLPQANAACGLYPHWRVALVAPSADDAAQDRIDLVWKALYEISETLKHA